MEVAEFINMKKPKANTSIIKPKKPRKINKGTTTILITLKIFLRRILLIVGEYVSIKVLDKPSPTFCLTSFKLRPLRESLILKGLILILLKISYRGRESNPHIR